MKATCGPLGLQEPQRYLENADVRIGVGRPSGAIRSIVWKRTGLDLFRQVRGGIPGYVGALRIYDEHDDCWYDDLRTPFDVSDVLVADLSGAGPPAVRCTRHYRKAPFAVDVELRLEPDALHWEVSVVKENSRVTDRSLRVYFALPLIAGWDVWAPCAHGETTFDGMTPFEFMYVQVPYVSRQEVILPMVSHYHRGLDVGFSLMEPIDANVPAAKFQFNNGERCFNWGSMHKDFRTVPMLEAVNYYIGLTGERPMRTKVMLMFHAGDWRCGLGKVYRRWREYFDPWNDAIYDREGGFLCGGVECSDEIDKLKAMGLKTLEVHGHFQDYSDYFQAGKDRWLRLNTKESVYHKLVAQRKAAAAAAAAPTAPAAPPATPPPAVAGEDVEEFFRTHTDDQVAAFLGQADPARLYHHRDDIRRRLQALADAGIACHWYFNYTDGYRPRVEVEWPDSISRDEDGQPIPSGWYMCHNMNADPRWSFGKFALDSAEKIFQTYPMLRGLFLDCFRHYEIDFAHDDGVTVVSDRPAYSMNGSYDAVERQLKERLMLPRNLTSFANKPMSIRSMRYVDAQLLEGCGDMYEEKFFWGSIACPMFFMFFTHDQNVDFFLRRSVLHGSFPTLVERTDENIALYRRYMPLFEQFRRRVFCFEPDPMRVPANSHGKLYTVPDGYVAGISCDHLADGDEVRYARTPYALFRVARAADVTAAAVMYPGDVEPRPVRFKFDGTFLAVPMQDYRNCAVVKLSVPGGPGIAADAAAPAAGGRAIGADTFTSRPRMCADPDSAFEDISER